MDLENAVEVASEILGNMATWSEWKTVAAMKGNLIILKDNTYLDEDALISKREAVASLSICTVEIK